MFLLAGSRMLHFHTHPRICSSVLTGCIISLVSEMEMLNEDKLIKLIIEYVDFWYFGSPAEAPVIYTLVVQGGKNGYACYKEGNGLIFMDPKVAGGYVEGIFYEIARRLIILLTILQPRWQTFSYTKAKECLHWF
jgi:hypothetical protein